MRDDEPENGVKDVEMIMLRECTDFRQEWLHRCGMLLLFKDYAARFT